MKFIELTEIKFLDPADKNSYEQKKICINSDSIVSFKENTREKLKGKNITEITLITNETIFVSESYKFLLRNVLN